MTGEGCVFLSAQPHFTKFTDGFLSSQPHFTKFTGGSVHLIYCKLCHVWTSERGKAKACGAAQAPEIQVTASLNPVSSSAK